MEFHVWHAGALVSLLFAVPGLVLLIEVLFAKLRDDVSGSSAEPPPSFRVLIPAHDEAGGLGECLRALKPLLPSPETALVVADNCTDDTAAIAKAEGVEVLVRDVPELRGKGYALQHGLDHLALDPPECIVFLDADSSYVRGAPADLAELVKATGRPVQGVFRMEAGEGGSLSERVAALAVRVKNDLRVRGLARVGGAVSLLGSNFALPWSACQAVPLPEGELAEDAVLGWRLADAGLAPHHTTRAACEGRLARGGEATRIQRGRWERGTLLGSWRVLPGVLARAALRGRPGVMLLALDGLVPPLSLLAFGCLVCAAIGGPLGMPPVWSLTPLGIISCALLLSWIRVGRDLVAPHELFALPLHAIVRILRLPSTILAGREWRRTPRERVAEE